MSVLNRFTFMCSIFRMFFMKNVFKMLYYETIHNFGYAEREDIHLNVNTPGERFIR